MKSPWYLYVKSGVIISWLISRWVGGIETLNYRKRSYFKGFRAYKNVQFVDKKQFDGLQMQKLAFNQALLNIILWWKRITKNSHKLLNARPISYDQLIRSPSSGEENIKILKGLNNVGTFHSNSRQNACRKNTCPQTASCLNGFSPTGYTCECQPGFTGSDCEKGENNR